MIAALLEIQFGDPKRTSQFDCTKCPDRVRALRRCSEDRWDFGPEDAAFWPIRITQGGTMFGFCPAKATWDARVMALYKALVVSAETGTQWTVGGIAEQPDWWVDLLSWFAPAYNESRFNSRARAILGDGSSKPGGPANGAQQGTTRNPNQR